MGRHGASRFDTTQRIGPRDWIVSLVVAALITSVVGTVAAVEEPEGILASGNLVTNGTFDSGDTGWHGNSSTRLVVAEGESEGRALGLENITQAPRTVVLNDRDDTVASSVAGHTYRASARVQVHEPEQSVVLRLREWDHSKPERPRIVGQRLNHDWVTTTRWQTIEVDYTAVRDGSTLDLNLVAYRLGAGHRIDVDDVSVVDLTADAEVPISEVTPPPTAPAPTPAPEPTPTPEPSPEPPPVLSGTNWRLVFNDEFNGSEVNRDNWSVYHQSTYGDGNNELACLMDRPENVSVADGVLTISARAEKPAMKCGDRDSRFANGRSFSSGFLDSRGKASFEYGRFEVRVKTPNAYGHTKGLWPAFWLRPDNGGLGEIDVFEIIGTSPGEPDTSNRTTQSIHYDYVKTHPKQNQAYDLPHGNFADGFHTHAVEWGPGFLRWYVDDVLTYERTINTTPWLNEAFSGKFHMRLNMAVGGNWTGSPDAHTRLPADFEVDYVRVYQMG